MQPTGSMHTQADRKLTSYQVIDRQTGAIVRTFTQATPMHSALTLRRRARQYADRLDLEYGAVRYTVMQASKA